MSMNSLQDALIHELKDLLSAEKQLTKALPKMAEKATDPKLKECFESHLKETEGHVNRLEKAIEAMNGKISASKCEAMSGLIEEGKEILESKGDADVQDSMIIAAAQKVEHYEIGSYGTACTWAEMLGQDEVKRLLEQTLEEEKAADKKLTQIAMTVNKKAMKAA